MGAKTTKKKPTTSQETKRDEARGASPVAADGPGRKKKEVNKKNKKKGGSAASPRNPILPPPSRVSFGDVVEVASARATCVGTARRWLGKEMAVTSIVRGIFEDPGLEATLDGYARRDACLFAGLRARIHLATALREDHEGDDDDDDDDEKEEEDAMDEEDDLPDLELTPRNPTTRRLSPTARKLSLSPQLSSSSSSSSLSSSGQQHVTLLAVQVGDARRGASPRMRGREARADSSYMRHDVETFPSLFGAENPSDGMMMMTRSPPPPTVRRSQMSWNAVRNRARRLSSVGPPLTRDDAWLEGPLESRAELEACCDALASALVSEKDDDARSMTRKNVLFDLLEIARGARRDLVTVDEVVDRGPRALVAILLEIVAADALFDLPKADVTTLLVCVDEELTLVFRRTAGTFVATRRLGPEALKTHVFALDRGLDAPSLAFNSNSAVNIRDAYLDRFFDASEDEALGYRTRSLLCVPVVDPQSKAAVGVVQFTNCLLQRGAVAMFDSSRNLEMDAAQATQAHTLQVRDFEDPTKTRDLLVTSFSDADVQTALGWADVVGLVLTWAYRRPVQSFPGTKLFRQIQLFNRRARRDRDAGNYETILAPSPQRRASQRTDHSPAMPGRRLLVTPNLAAQNSPNKADHHHHDASSPSSFDHQPKRPAPDQRSGSRVARGLF